MRTRFTLFLSRQLMHSCGVLVFLCTPAMAQLDAKALLLTNNVDTLPNLDEALGERLETVHGAEVTYLRPNGMTTAELDAVAREHDMVLISETIASTAVLDNGDFTLRDTPVSVLSFEQYMWEDAFWTELPQFGAFGNTGRTDNLIEPAVSAGLEDAQSDIYITPAGAGHPLAQGFSEGALTVYTQPYSASFATPHPSAKVIATADAAGTFATHLLYDVGDTLVDGSTVPAPRIGLFLGQNAPGNAPGGPQPEYLSEAGWKFLDNAFRYAILGPDAFGVPGDVNLDDVTNQEDFDIISMNVGLTPAERTDGDLNFNNVVDLLDFRIWKRNDGATAGTPLAATVPEPAAGALALLAFAALCSRGIRPKS